MRSPIVLCFFPVFSASCTHSVWLVLSVPHLVSIVRIISADLLLTTMCLPLHLPLNKGMYLCSCSGPGKSFSVAHRITQFAPCLAAGLFSSLLFSLSPHPRLCNWRHVFPNFPLLRARGVTLHSESHHFAMECPMHPHPTSN